MSTDEKWHEWRGQGIGGSDIGALMGVSSHGSPCSVWAEKVGAMPPSETTERQQIGKDFEAPLAASFNRKTGLDIGGQQAWLSDTANPHRRCTVDGFVLDGDERVAVWECKTDARFGLWETPENVPPAIYMQCQWNAGVAGLPGTWLTVFHNGFNIEHLYVPFVPAVWAELTETADRFWFDHVVTGVMPPVDGSDATLATLAVLWPEHVEGLMADIDPDLFDRWQQTNAIKNGAEKAEKALKAELAVAIGEAEIGGHDGTPLVTYKAQTRKTTCAHCGAVDESAPFRVLRKAPVPKIKTRSEAA